MWRVLKSHQCRYIRTCLRCVTPKQTVVVASFHHQASVNYIAATEGHSQTPIDSNLTPEEHGLLKDIVSAEMDRRLSNRYQPISKREDRCDMPTEVCKANSKGHYLSTYRGCTIIKSPEDFPLYHMFFSHLKPHTVIELGTYGGGSAIWMADQLKLLDVPAHIYSMPWTSIPTYLKRKLGS